MDALLEPLLSILLWDYPSESCSDLFESKASFQPPSISNPTSPTNFNELDSKEIGAQLAGKRINPESNLTVHQLDKQKKIYEETEKKSLFINYIKLRVKGPRKSQKDGLKKSISNF